MFVNFNILNQLGSPAINSNTFANRPAAGQTGRLFVSTDTFEIYRDNGTTWDLIGGPGSSTITGTGTATQVAYFTSSQAIGSSSNLYWDNANIRLGIGTASPGARLDIHGSGTVGQFNGTTSASNIYLAFQRGGSGLWRIGDTYNSGDNFFELHNTVLGTDAMEFQATTNKSTFLAQQNYLGGLAQGNLFTYNLTIPAGTTVATPNAVSAVNAYLNLSLGGNVTMPAGTRQGIEGNSRLSFTGAGTLTMSQGSTLRAYAAITGVHSFAGSAVGTITHLAGMRLCFPDNIGSAVNVTNNYALLINDQTTGTGTVTYTNRWGIYQEGASDLNYFAANMLIGSTVNNGSALQVTGSGTFSSTLTAGGTIQSNDQNAFWLNQPGNTTDTKLWAIQNLVTSGTFRIRALNDGATNGINAIEIARTGISSVTTAFMGGNVGIGTTSPSNKLVISNGGAYGFEFDPAGSTLLTYNRSTSSYATFALNALDYQFYTSASERMRITSGGNVLIGTTTDAGQKLQVNGNGYIIGDLNLGYGSSPAADRTLSIGTSTNYYWNIVGFGNNMKIQDAAATNVMEFVYNGGVRTNSFIRTGTPNGGTAAEWKFGQRVAATVVLDTTQYIQLDVNGTLYKIAIVT